MKFLDDSGLAHLIAKIKATFISTSSVAPSILMDVDITPTQGSTRLVTSNGIWAAISASGEGKGDSLWKSGSSSGVVQSGSTGTAEGYLGACVGGPNTSSGDYSFAGGYGSNAPGYSAFAFGNYNRAEGNYSHAEGARCAALGEDSHAEGFSTTASGDESHAEGLSTITRNLGEHASGKFNSSTQTSYNWGDAGNTHFSVGVGNKSGDNVTRSNALEIMQNGDIYMKGVGSYTGTYASSGIKSLQTVIGEKATAATTLAGYGITDATINTDGTIILGNTSISVPIISTNVVSDRNDDTKTSSPKSVYSEIHPATASSQPAGGMLPNVLYKLGTLTGNVTISFAAASDANIENEYKFTFTAGSTALTITWPASITMWAGNCVEDGVPTITGGNYYEVSVEDGVAFIVEVEA